MKNINNPGKDPWKYIQPGYPGKNPGECGNPREHLGEYIQSDRDNPDKHLEESGQSGKHFGEFGQSFNPGKQLGESGNPGKHLGESEDSGNSGKYLEVWRFWYPWYSI